MPSFREQISKQQAQMVQALMCGGEAPAGASVPMLVRTSQSLRNKRRRCLERMLPATLTVMGDRFAHLVTRYFGEHPSVPAAAQDALSFLKWLRSRELLPPAARGELLCLRARCRTGFAGFWARLYYEVYFGVIRVATGFRDRFPLSILRKSCWMPFRGCDDVDRKAGSVH
ncbi:MAG: hypothetical protein ACR2IE_12830 [Candidatus Sumerlaeaceae bacterium]